ncbi:cytochrome P450 3A29-like [Leucoraja erinacea]|uniref:cytochrome P450 3A29-like n=1 Tax=Leucoraja erinaceus TaxID=7782 RepID=UPI00245460BB|nr:cytochrome P450 3A29-like [Leucoraja erinacea]
MDLIQEFLIPPWLVPLVSSEPWLYLCEITSNPWIWRGLVLLLFGLYVCWPHSTFKELYIPGPSPRLFLGSIPDFYRKDIHIVDLESYDTFGDIWGLLLGRQPFLMIADTEIIHKLFIVEDGKIFADVRARRSHCPFSESFFQAEEFDQRRIHQLLSAAFGDEQLRQVFPLMVLNADELVCHFGKFYRNGESVVVRELFGRYVRDALMMSMFGADVDTHGIGKHPYTYYWDLILTAHRKYAVISPSLIFPCLKPLLRTLKFHFYWKEAIGYFTELVRHAQAQRKQATQSTERVGILHHLLDRAEASADPGRKLSPGYTGMSEGELVAQMLRILVSAFNAATFSLEFAAYLLARHPSAQHRLQVEAARTAGHKVQTAGVVARTSGSDWLAWDVGG